MAYAEFNIDRAASLGHFSTFKECNFTLILWIHFTADLLSELPFSAVYNEPKNASAETTTASFLSQITMAILFIYFCNFSISFKMLLFCQIVHFWPAHHWHIDSIK